MSDLISRSELLKAMDTWDKFGYDEHNRLIKIDRTNEEYVPFVHYEDMVNCVKNMPTAYDVDKVVEELKEAKHEICLSDEDLEHYQNGIDNAIEIVKQGGVSDDVCWWKLDKEFDFANSDCGSLDTHRIDFLKMKYCPYCSKKIRTIIK